MEARAARQGDTVLVHFDGRLEDGTVAESSRDGEPERVAIGTGMINPAFEEALVGMRPGERVTVPLTAKQAYGPYKKRLVFKLKRRRLNLTTEPEPGQWVRVTLPSGQSSLVTVTAVTATGITVDANHPLAGEDLTFELELVAILEGE
jgi:peptidylprolyl isomerase